MCKVLADVQEYDSVKSGRELLKAAKRGDLNHTLIRIYMQVAFSIQPGSTITAEETQATVNAYEKTIRTNGVIFLITVTLKSETNHQF
jgi:hypothetical protein